MADTATFFLLAKSTSRVPDQDPPAYGQPGAVDIFNEALQNIAARAGVKINSAYVAQGIYDFIIELTVDAEAFVRANPVVGQPTPRQIVLGLSAALSRAAGVLTETVPVEELADPTIAEVAHWCTYDLAAAPSGDGSGIVCLGTAQTHVDPRTLHLEDYVAITGPLPPAVAAPNVARPWGFLGNRYTGDCALAAAGHAEQVWAAPQRPSPAITAGGVMRAYSDLLERVQSRAQAPPAPPPGGAVPVPTAVLAPNQRAGVKALDALNYWRQVGIAGHHISAYAAVRREDPDWVRFAIDRFGCAYVVLGLPDGVLPRGITAHTAPDWTDVPTGADARINPANSHCVIYVAYDDQMTLTAVTWGRTMLTSWDFHSEYCEEMYVALSSSRPVPDGLDVTRWEADVERAEAPPAG